MAGHLDDHDLHAQAQAQVGHLVLTGIARCGDLAFDAAWPKPPGTTMPAALRKRSATSSFSKSSELIQSMSIVRP